ncbi:MAG TPA: hypothetical protein VFR21_08500 [Bradyrhizobium sp.]|nr:hypothetical protein [Bradyrhizobium sp.]
MRQALANIGAETGANTGAKIGAKIGAKTGGMRRRLRFGSKAAFHLRLLHHQNGGALLRGLQP